MKKTILISFILLCFFVAKASHFSGGEITYRYIGDSTGVDGQYLVQFVLSSDNSGVTIPSSISLTVSSPCVAQFNINLNQLYTVSDPFYNSCAYNLSVSPYEFTVYRGMFTKSSFSPWGCQEFTISFSQCCRNVADNIFDPLSQNFYLEAKAFIANNNSSTSAIPNPRVFFAGHEYYWPHLMYDEDGDSIYMEVVQSKGSATQNLAYEAGYTTASPVTVDTIIGFNVDPKTGNIHFKPVNQERAVITLKVSEYRFDSTLFYYVKIAERTVDKQADIIAQPGGFGKIELQKNSVDYSCNSTFVEIETTKSFLNFSLATDASDFIVINPLGQLVPIVSAKAQNIQLGNSSIVRLNLFGSFSVNGTYQVVAMQGTDGNTLINACDSALAFGDTTTFTVSNCSGIGFQESLLAQTKLYPNPVTSVLHLSINHELEYNISLYNTTGLLLNEYMGRQDDLEINMSRLPAGVYYVKMQSGEYSIVEKVIKQ